MSFVIKTAIFINIFTILLFCGGLLTACKEMISPKIRATLGGLMAVLLTLYIFVMAVIFILGLFLKHPEYCISILFMILPFILGHYASYEKLKLYTILQILCLGLSLGYLFYL